MTGLSLFLTISPSSQVKGNNLPDFERPHQCVSYASVLDWAQKHAMPEMFQAYEKHQAPPSDAIFADWELFHGDLGDLNRWLTPASHKTGGEEKQA